ncbi:MAG TPA: hypothetical protein VOA88_08455 [Candidatus Dormibacteraeota bacterium]|nr:hypothetical protein [Candidatus Dormibacteraeota bacterium]
MWADAAVAWTHDQDDPGYEECGQKLWRIALGYARKFSGSKQETVHGQTKEDLAVVGALHILMQSKKGRLDKVPAAARWGFICQMLWNRMIDEARKFSNRFELQSPTLKDGDGVMDSDEALDLVANRFTPRPVTSRELRMLERMLDNALATLPDAMLIKLRFGLCRNDELGEDEPQFLEAMNFDDLVSVGYGPDRFAVKRRLDTALERLRAALLVELERNSIVNFMT